MINISSGGSVVRNCLQYRRHGFDHGIGKIPLIKKWQPTPVFLPGKSHEQRSLVGYCSRGLKRVKQGLATNNNNNKKCKMHKNIITISEKHKENNNIQLLSKN